MPLNSKDVAPKSQCDWCQGKKNRNQQVVHVLTHTSREALAQHLNCCLSPATRLFFLDLWDTAYLLYGHLSRDKFQPLALVYLEEHAIKVPNRFEWIKRYRDKIGATSND